MGMFTSSKRNATFELVRIIAMVLAVCFYVTKAFPLGDYSGWGFTVCSVFYRLAAPFFLFLCGRFALSFDFANKSLKDFYIKKTAYIVIPMLFFMICHYLFNTTEGSNDTNVIDFFPCLAYQYKSTHFWLMYYLLFYILSTPILSLMFKDISDRALKSYIVVGLVFNSLSYYVDLVPTVDFSYANQFGKVLFYFFLGGLSDRIINLFGRKKLYIAGVVSFPIVLLQTFIFDTANTEYDLSPFYVVFAFSIYIYLTSLNVEENKITSNALSFFGKYVFGVCMIQGIIIKHIVNNNILPTNNIWLFVCSGVIVVLIVSIVLSLFTDILLFGAIRRLLCYLSKKNNN